MGNHDMVPANYFPYLNDTSFTIHNEEIESRDKLLKDLKEIWGLPDAFLKAGYYSTNIDQDRWCLISINRYLYYPTNNLDSNLYYHLNAFRLYYYPDSDPEGQFTFLHEQLQACSPKPVILLAHAPPGVRDHSKVYKRQLEKLFKHYPSPIVILTGHTHTDYFQTLGGKAVNFVGPSLTGWQNVTSAVRVVELEGEIGMRNFQTFLFKRGLEKGGDWQMEYDWQRDYQLPDASMQSANLLTKLLQIDPKKRNSFCRHYARKSQVEEGKCLEFFFQFYFNNM
jgi:hypothetical protein